MAMRLPSGQAAGKVQTAGTCPLSLPFSFPLYWLRMCKWQLKLRHPSLSPRCTRSTGPGKIDVWAHGGPTPGRLTSALPSLRKKCLPPGPLFLPVTRSSISLPPMAATTPSPASKPPEMSVLKNHRQCLIMRRLYSLQTPAFLFCMCFRLGIIG